MSEQSSVLQPDLEYPKIRPVEALPHPEGSEKGVCLRDPRQFAKNVLVLPPPVFFMVAHFDGNHSLRDIQELFMRKHGELVPLAKIQAIAKQLDREFFLESQTFYEQKQAVVEAFRSDPIRQASHAGTAYPGDKKELRAQLNQLLDSVREKEAEDPPPQNQDLSLLISPHIDLHRGGECFAFAYRELARHTPADLYIIFGTAHQSERNVIALTRKSFSTPLGVVETDADFVDRYNDLASFDPFEDEFLHRDEHSIEFQVLWLQHVLGDHWRGKIVPILCGSFHPYIQAGISPREDQQTAQALDVLRQVVAEYSGRIVAVAGVDFSHVGRRFGHLQGLSPRELERVTHDDRQVLESLHTGEAEAFYRAIEEKKDRNNVCGLSPIYMALDVVRAGRGFLLSYDQAVEDDAQSMVTFASMAFYR
ncbi:MAG: AmmeMemoRadiSam system protein B [Candidatus Omnitrophica bacterium]|nr:AmmeMemoRadiSam system protein B [Candidatus Omnitrophota bacterium]